MTFAFRKKDKRYYLQFLFNYDYLKYYSEI